MAPPDDLLAQSGTKRDKRQIRHASFVSRIEKASSGSQGKNRPLRRRRPGKKLNTSLGALADALPDLGPEEAVAQLREGKVRHRSLGSRKGALRRKEKVVRGEVERFGVSLARLNALGAAAPAASGGGDAEAQAMQIEDGSAGVGSSSAEYENTQTRELRPAAPNPTANRWAALRGFISATMEQNPAFVGNKQDGK